MQLDDQSQGHILVQNESKDLLALLITKWTSSGKSVLSK